jgi:hypothetical protein
MSVNMKITFNHAALALLFCGLILLLTAKCAS